MIKCYKKRSFKRAAGECLIILLFVSIVSCSGAEEAEDITISESTFATTIGEPVERDLAEIQQRGTFRMITYYSSNTYFLNQGIEVGFEYELIREFTRENDLALEVVIVGADENPFELLNSGAGGCNRGQLHHYP